MELFTAPVGIVTTCSGICINRRCLQVSVLILPYYCIHSTEFLTADGNGAWFVLLHFCLCLSVGRPSEYPQTSADNYVCKYSVL